MKYGTGFKSPEAYQSALPTQQPSAASPTPANRARTVLPLLMTAATIAVVVGFYSSGGPNATVAATGLDAAPQQHSSAVPAAPASLPSSKTGEQPASKPASQPVSKPAGQTGAQPASQPVSKPASQPVSKPAEQPVTKPAGQPASQPGQQPVTKPAQQPVPAPAVAPAPAPALAPDTDVGESDSSFNRMGSGTTHICFIMVDDMGHNDMGYSSTDMTKATPHMSAMAESGIILSNYYTQQSCTPARVAMLSGRYPANVGMGYDSRGSFVAISPYGLPLEYSLLPQYLKDLNYTTAIVGKWNLGHFAEEYLPHRRGFDSALTFQSDEMHYYNYTLEPQLSGLAPIDMLLGSAGQPYELASNVSGYSTAVFTDRAIRMVELQDPSDPLFLYLAYQAVHVPHDTPPHDLYEEDVDGWRIEASSDLHYRHNFGKVLIAMDKSIAKVVNSFEENEMLDSTFFVVASDNGGCPSDGSNNYPLRGGKFDLYQGGVHVPAFVYSKLLPDAVTGHIHSGLFHVTDWLPTLLRVAQYDYDVKSLDIDGVNQLPSLFKQGDELDASERSELLVGMNTWGVSNTNEISKLSFEESTMALISGDYKLYVGAQDRGWYAPADKDAVNCSCGTSNKNSHTYLFNMVDDPREETDLADARPAVTKKMLSRLQEYYNNATASVWKAPETMQAIEQWINEGYVTPWHRPDATPLNKVMPTHSPGEDQADMMLFPDA